MRRPCLKALAWLLVCISAALILLSPVDQIMEGVVGVMPWVAGGLAVSEALFVAGLFIMGSGAGVRLGRRPSQWTDRLRGGDQSLLRSTTFRIGFWTNAVGAVGSAVVVAVGILLGLPAGAWGLMALPILDLIVTVGLRASLLSLDATAA